MPQAFLPSLPAVKLVLAQETALLLDVDIAVPQRVHGKKVVAVTQLEAHHLLGGHQIRKFRLLVAALLEELLEEQGVLAHALHGFEEVTGQVHLVAQLGLLPPEEGRAVLGHESVRLGLVLVVQGVEVKVLFVPQEALADEEGKIVAPFQLAQEVVVVEAVDLFDVAENDVPLAPHCLRDILTRQLRNVVLRFQQQKRKKKVGQMASN